MLDKGRASIAGRAGEHRFNGKGMDRHFYTFTGIEFEPFKAAIASGKGDGEMLAWVHEHAKFARQPWEIAQWSTYHENRIPDSDTETWSEFGADVAKFSRTREDIRTWFEFLDLEDHCGFGGLA
jgi:hypothetical protein